MTPRLASTHPPVAGDSERAHPKQLLDQCVGASGLVGGGGARSGCQVAEGGGTRGRKPSLRATGSPSPTWPRPREEGLPPSCDASPRPTRLQPLPVSVPGSRGPRDTVGGQSREAWILGGRGLAEGSRVAVKEGDGGVQGVPVLLLQVVLLLR